MLCISRAHVAHKTVQPFFVRNLHKGEQKDPELFGTRQPHRSGQTEVAAIALAYVATRVLLRMLDSLWYKLLLQLLESHNAPIQVSTHPQQPSSEMCTICWLIGQAIGLLPATSRHLPCLSMLKVPSRMSSWTQLLYLVIQQVAEWRLTW